MRRVALLLLVSVGWFVASAPPSEAAFVSGFVGNSGLSATPGSADGWVNFAVYDNSGGLDWRSELGVTVSNLPSGQAVTGYERAVFFYQVVRDGLGDARLTEFAVASAGPVAWNGIGFLDGWVFRDSLNVAVGPSGNQTLGTEAAPFGSPGDVRTDGQLSAPPSSFVTQAGAASLLDGAITSPTTAFFQWSFVNAIQANQFSSVLVLTSESDPNLLTWGTAGTVVGGATGPQTTVPTTSPEPGSLVLLGLAMVVGGAGYGWKRRKQKAAEQQSS